MSGILNPQDEQNRINSLEQENLELKADLGIYTIII